MTQIESITIEDDLSIQDRAAIEVSLKLKNGEKRWCLVFSPEAISRCGDWIKGTTVPFHYGTSHTIVIGAKLTEDLIHRAMYDLDSKDMIYACTMPLK